MSKGNKWGAKTLDAAMCLGAPKIPIAGIGSLMIEDRFVRKMAGCKDLSLLHEVVRRNGAVAGDDSPLAFSSKVDAGFTFREYDQTKDESPVSD